ncbi:DUF6415 family natural product biosynthesis protein [Streptomyces sp. NPDC057565]|uniref:DUF6415 family natural product biosynthesis protein n=1 Tax=Streptomyces sp. NPDC057565 TaxID=3346169 RepID=UPI003680200F
MSVRCRSTHWKAWRGRSSLSAVGAASGVVRNVYVAAQRPVVSQSMVMRAGETIGLVIDDEAPVPKRQQDVEDLLLRLRGHLMELGAEGPRTGPWTQALVAVRELAAQAPPTDDFLQSRVHLRRLALQLKSVLDHMGGSRPVPGSQR